MPIGSFILQPVANSINAAYRPVIIRVAATKTNGNPIPPVVYCDIYFNGIYYRTISKQQYTKLNALNSEWEFDIQDKVQEYLSKFLANNGEENIVLASPLITSILCKFRSSGIDIEGFIQTEDIAPIQGTDNTNPVAGTGTSSNTFYGVNATLQHEDNQNLATHLNTYKNRTWDATTYPLTHRPDHYKICKEDSDSFPIVSNKEPIRLTLKALHRNSAVFISHEQPCTNVSILGSPSLPDGVIGTPYIYTINLIGTVPFILANIVKPSWMTIAVVGSTIQFSGTPSISAHTGTGIVISFDITNCSIGLVSFSDTINIPCIGVSFSGTPNLPDGTISIPYSYSVTLLGTPPFVIQGTPTKPSWMTIVIVGNQLNFTGTPDISGVGIVVNVTVENCNSISTANINQTIDILACIAVFFDSGTVLPNAIIDQSYSFTILLGGSPPFAIQGTPTKPSWMTIAIVGDELRFTGTPTTGNEGTNIPINVTVQNCVGANSVNLSDLIDVLGYKYYLADEYACGDCSAPIQINILVAILESHVVTNGNFYRPIGFPTGFTYKVYSTIQGSGIAYILTTTNFSTCVAAC